MPTCMECDLEKDSSEFYVYNGGSHSPICRACVAIRARERYYERRDYLDQRGVAAFREKYGKKNHPLTKTCKVCGVEKDIELFPYERVHDLYKNTCRECCAHSHYIEIKTITTTKVVHTTNYSAPNLTTHIDKNDSLENKAEVLCSICKKKLFLLTSAYTRNLSGVIVCVECRIKIDSCKRKVNSIKKCAKKVLMTFVQYGEDTHDFYLGCKGSQFKTWLESQFIEGMTWENMGMYGWHIDHYVPIRYFDSNKEEELRVCFNYQNIQPLCAKDNLMKSGSLPIDYKEHIQKIKTSLGIL